MEQSVATLKIGKAPVQVEVRTDADPERDVSVLPELSFDGVVESIEAITLRLTSVLTKVRPDRAKLEFGVDVGLEAGQLTALLVKGTGSATIKITLEWEAAQPAPAQ